MSQRQRQCRASLESALIQFAVTQFVLPVNRDACSNPSLQSKQVPITGRLMKIRELTPGSEAPRDRQTNNVLQQACRQI
ncbi:hypothetical protein D3C78_1824390 [compost metagenome]